MSRRRILGVSLGMGVLGAMAFFGWRASHLDAPLVSRMAPPSDVKTHPSELAVMSGSNTKKLESYIARNANSPDRKVQDMVGAVRIRLAARDADAGHFETARQTLLTTVRQYKGTGAMNADFGGVDDQAAYQAAVCLVAENKKDEAAKEFRRFLHDRPLSPLDTACYRRLIRLNNGQTTHELDSMLQKDIDLQEEHIRFETSVCGPKTIQYLLAQPNGLGSSVPESSRRLDFKQLAKICGTTNHGTSIEQMRKGLKTLGIESYAFRLNRKDLGHAPMPAILLDGDHYVAILKVNGDKATCFDTRYNAEREIALPPMDDPDFAANLILFSPPPISSSLADPIAQ